MYEVIRKFEDKDGRTYESGDVYPHVDAKKPTNARLKTLSTNENQYGKTYIKKFEV